MPGDEQAHHGSHAGHSHAISTNADRGKLVVALALILGFMAVEVVVAILANSLALLADAAHMTTDAAAIGLALIAASLAARPASGRFTFGLKRAEILSAQFNGATLLLLGLLIVYEGIRRLAAPPDVEGLAVLLVAIAGVVVNLAATWTLSKANRASMNIEGAFQHILTDLFAFAATAVAGAIVLATGFGQADGIAALVVAASMLLAAYRLLRDSGRIFLEAAPEGIDSTAVGAALARENGVLEVHDLHIWEVTSGFPALSGHVIVERDTDCHAVRRRLEELLREQFHIEHTTLQVDHRGGELLQVERPSGELDP